MMNLGAGKESRRAADPLPGDTRSVDHASLESATTSFGPRCSAHLIGVP
jgi:hypothetical protein